MNSTSVNENDPANLGAVMQLAEKGDRAALLRLLHGGLPPALLDQVLHEAIDRQMLDLAALVLRHGASTESRNRKGQLPFSENRIRICDLHRLRQHYKRTPNPAYQARDLMRDDPVLQDLRTHGIARIPKLIEPPLITRLKDSVDQMVAGIDAKLERGQGKYQYYDEEEHYWEQDGAYVCNNALKYSDDLTGILCSEPLLSRARAYLMDDAFLQRVMLYRYTRSHNRRGDMFHYHHDMYDRMFKVMILLTDVTESDHYMSYVAGTHNEMRPIDSFFQNDAKRPDNPVREIKTIGQAGDAFIFDPNGAHSASLHDGGAVRDVVIAEYNNEISYMFGATLPDHALERFPVTGAHPLTYLARLAPVWKSAHRRKYIAWIESLPRTGQWILR